MSHTYELLGYVTRVEAEMLDTSITSAYQAVPGYRYVTVKTRGGEHRFELQGEEPKLGTIARITVVVG